MLDHDLLNPLANLTHRSTSCFFPWIRPRDDLNHRGRKTSFAIAQLLDWPRVDGRPGERRQAPPRQYTGFRNPAMAFFAHPVVVRLPYFKSLVTGLGHPWP